tara:strand:+ start:97 stop:312 length:216 start_codon:yes stop_codon:yes gene_type:complete
MKTRIKVLDGLYCPQYRSWGMWFGIVVEADAFGPMYYSNNLRIAQITIDRYLKKHKEKVKGTSIIEYPLND